MAALWLLFDRFVGLAGAAERGALGQGVDDFGAGEFFVEGGGDDAGGDTIHRNVAFGQLDGQ